MRAVLALIALMLLVLAFAALAPATLVDTRVATLTRGAVRLADASGTLWSGSGTLYDARGRWRVPVAWRLDVAPLLRGGARVELVPRGDATGYGTLSLQDDRIELTALHLDIPAAAVESAWTRPPVPQLQGVIVADAPSFALDRANASGALDLRWERARIGVIGVALDLGTVEARARPDGAGIVVALGNRGGDLALRGEARADGRTLTLDATLTPSPSAPQSVVTALRALGGNASDGSAHVTWRGQR